jgi:dTDP-glucose 4,6-dehydratase
MKRNILIIGSNSFSGSNLTSKLLIEGHRVLGISRQNEVQAPYKPYSLNKNFEFYKLDLNNNMDDIVKLCLAREIDTIFNFSAQSMVGESWIYPDHWYETNIVALSKLINGLVKQKSRLLKFVQFTTPEVYGSTVGSIKENFNFSPTTPYAISRAAGDFHLRAMFESFAFPVIFTRAANVYGEYQSNYRVIPRTFIYGLTNRKLNLHGGGNSERSFIHIDDVSSALLSIMENGELGSTYHISSNTILTIREIVEKCCNIMDIEFDSLCNISDDRVGKDAAYKLDSTLIRNNLNWKDRVSLDEGLSRTYNWVHTNIYELLKQPLDYQHRK